MEVVVVGVGAMGKRHIEIAQRLDMDVVAICDLDQSTLDAVGQHYNIEAQRRFLGINQMLENVHPDCMIIATTAPSHCDLTLLAAEAGIPYILCEKPMATSIADCNRMIDACSKNGVRLGINHHMRFLDRFQFIQEQVRQEEFGGLQSMTIITGNIGLVNNGCHLIDSFAFLAKEDIESVTAWFSKTKITNPRGALYEDYGGSIRLTTVSGKHLYINADEKQGHGINLVVAGQYGQLYMDYISGYCYGIHRQQSDLPLPTTRYASPSQQFTHQLQSLNILDSTSRLLSELVNNQPVPDGHAGRRTIEILVAAYLSHENNHQEIKLNEVALDENRTFPWA